MLLCASCCSAPHIALLFQPHKATKPASVISQCFLWVMTVTGHSLWRGSYSFSNLACCFSLLWGRVATDTYFHCQFICKLFSRATQSQGKTGELQKSLFVCSEMRKPDAVGLLSQKNIKKKSLYLRGCFFLDLNCKNFKK